METRSRNWRPVLAALLVIAAGACGDDDGEVGTAGPTTADAAADTREPVDADADAGGDAEGPCAVLTEADMDEELGLRVTAATPGGVSGTETCSYELDADPAVYVIVFIARDVPPGQDLGAGLDEVRGAEVAGAEDAVIGVQRRGTGGDHVVALVAGTMLTISVGPIGTADAEALVALAERAVPRLDGA